MTASFPHLRVGTFIEAPEEQQKTLDDLEFPHLRVGTFIEAVRPVPGRRVRSHGFPHLRVGTFIEAETPPCSP